MSGNLAIILFLVLVPTAAGLSHLFAKWMCRIHLGQRIREYGPKLHMKKSGTPTMGGAVILAMWGIVAGATALVRPIPWQWSFILASGGVCGAVGFLDDFISLYRHRSLGLRPYQKIVLMSLGAGLLFLIPDGIRGIPFRVPFSSQGISLPTWATFFIYWSVFLGTTNSMNLTDGLDGLAAGTAIIILSVYLVIAPGLSGVIVPLLAILAGFLWVNFHPARLFLGDVGAFGLGGIIAGTAVVTGTSFILPFLGGLLVIEAGSVILQVGSVKLFGKRIFKISPLHHHFEHADGIDYRFFLPSVEWPEEKIVVRFWIVEALFAVLGLLAVRL